jgi:nucleoside-diphosphate-sugar epimerase
MSAKRIVVLGASGFVGTSLVERLQKHSEVEVVPVIHSAGSAWRLARRSSPLVQVDITDRSALSDVLRGATHVVNCTRGGRGVMIDGLRNILDECRAARVSRFLHLSSVMVYGDPPHQDSHHEDAPTKPPPGADSYGMIKLEQDRMVQAAAATGLPSVVLCPPNISGPFSGYIAGIVNGLRNESFALVDEGATPCNLVDVRNLCHAIELALDHNGGALLDGTRIFVTDGEQVSWKDVVAELLELSGVEDVRHIERAELLRLAGRDMRTNNAPSVATSIRHLVSSEVRAALRKDPLLAKLDLLGRTAVRKMGRGIESKLRLGIEGPAPVSRPNPYASLTVGLCTQQLRDVRHLNERAECVLGFRPPVNFRQSMADFRAWYRKMHGMDTPFWDISRHLYGL